MMSRPLQRGIRLLLFLLLVGVVPPLHAQESTPDPVLELMAKMTPEAKVGQLVLVTFPGTDIPDGASILELIRDYRIGGVLLRPQNGNFGVAGIDPTSFISMTNRLQIAASDAASAWSLPAGEIGQSPSPYIPLLISLEANDAGIHPISLVAGASQFPTQMAVGATWDPALSEAIGTYLGRELAHLGVNLYFGPDLDVLYTPRPGDVADLGTTVFGGDPYWVSEMGTAYIRGLHVGSEGQMLVVPRHLPGLGSADRPPEEEVPTVQKPLEQLKQIDLVPFFAAAREAPGSAAAADGFLVTHIRYRGFQGNNIRRTTRPISLDATALQLVTGLPEVNPWRTSGGLLIADNLGLESVHRSYDPRGLTFNARRVAQDALSAGNDLLILDRFGSADNWNLHFANIRDTLKFLSARYKDEPGFQVMVDEAVYRILSAKLRIHPSFDIEAVARDPEALGPEFGRGGLVTTEVAQKGFTLVYPLSEDLVPPAPQEGETIVVFTQERSYPIGAGIEPVIRLRSDAIGRTILRFYGPDGTGIVRMNAVRTFTFQDLTSYLRRPVATLESPLPTRETAAPITTAVAVQNALRDADWIVFATSGYEGGESGTAALKSFLATEANLLDARIAVLAFGPPYELDQTETGKLAVYYALYSTGDPFVETGVRALFQARVATGASPVDIVSLNYSIGRQTMPNANQTISIYVVNELGEELTTEARANVHVGDFINLRTDVIVDSNGRAVPDGTPVQFLLSYPLEGDRQTMVAETLDGIASTSVTLARVGQLNITAQSEPAVSSVRLELTIRDDGITITEVEPTPTPTPTQTPTPTVTPSPTPTPNPVPSKIEQLPDPLRLPIPRRGMLIRWGLFGTLIVLAAAFFWARQRTLAPPLAMTVAVISAMGGLASYILLMVVARWLFPVWRFAMVGREYVAVLVTLIGGGVMFGLVQWLGVTRSQVTTPDEGSPKPSLARYLRSRS
jgi:beta-N-acetylhexosaminidase